jgi:hypothetical protein
MGQKRRDVGKLLQGGANIGLCLISLSLWIVTTRISPAIFAPPCSSFPTSRRLSTPADAAWISFSPGERLSSCGSGNQQLAYWASRAAVVDCNDADFARDICAALQQFPDVTALLPHHQAARDGAGGR